MATDVQSFYKDKTVFLTGGSGFLGKVTIAKLLCTTEVKRIYVLLRAKRGQEMRERCAAWDKDPVFGNLMKINPEALKRVVPCGGDCQEPDLGLSNSDRQVLIDEVQIVIHTAATVRFVEPLHIALAVNTRATLLMIQLAKEMSHLESFVHVSTAYSNCVVEHVSERFYPEHLTCPAEKILELLESISPELLDEMAPALMGKYPNTYTYTKALAEQLLQKEAKDLPLSIFRPGVIIASYKEPMPGWIDNLYGPIAVLYGAAFGILHITLLNLKAQAGIVPVDYCVNMVLTCAWNTARDASIKLSPEPPIYNFTPNNDNLITWGGFRDKAARLRYTYPLTKMMWLPFLHCTTIPWLFRFTAIFYHLLPGYGIDLALRLWGKKPRMIKLYDKIHKNIDILAPFVITSWSFDTVNTRKLWAKLSVEDQKLYDFNMSSVDWDDYFLQALAGVRIYLAKEEPGQEVVERARKIYRRFQFLHRLLQFTLYSVAALILWSILKRLMGLFV